MSLIRNQMGIGGLEEVFSVNDPSGGNPRQIRPIPLAPTQGFSYLSPSQRNPVQPDGGLLSGVTGHVNGVPEVLGLLGSIFALFER